MVLGAGKFEEKRDFLRMMVDCSAVVRINGDSSTVSARVKDLSAIGMQLIGNEAVGIGNKVIVEILLDEKATSPFIAEAEVVRCDPYEGPGYQLGLKILGVDIGL